MTHRSERYVDIHKPGAGTPVSAGRSSDASTNRRAEIAHLKTAAAWLLGAQLAAMIAFSSLEYHRYALSVGFGMYAQAWSVIGQGNLHPYSSFLQAPFWQNDAEFIVWPLSLLYRLYPHPIDLLVLQDVVLVTTEFVALMWILDVLRAADSLQDRVKAALAWGTLVVVVVDPFAYETIAYDFHTEVIAALFVALAGRALWRGTFRQLWLWVPLALCSLALASMYVIALGISALLAGRKTRPPGTMLVAAGLAYLLVLGMVDASGFGQAHSLGALYGYLVGPHQGVVRPADVLLGTVRHPWTAVSMIGRRWYLLFDFFIVFGVVGLWSVWVWPMAAAVMLPSALSAQVGFLNPTFSFQSWPAFMCLLVGTVMVLERLAGGGAIGMRWARATGGIWTVGLIVITLALLPTVPSRWLPIRLNSAAALSRLDARIPRDAEVIVSWGVAGRFGVRPDVHAYGPLSVRFPIDRAHVYFVVVPAQGNFEVRPSLADAAVRFVGHGLHARVVVGEQGVYGFDWMPPPSAVAVQLPGPASNRGLVSFAPARKGVG